MVPKMFFNSAGASPMSSKTTAAIYEHLELENRVGGYRAEDLIQDKLDSFYEETATLLGCTANEIAFTNSATDGYQKALSSIEFKKGDVILTTLNDYSSNHLMFRAIKEKLHIEIQYIKTNDSGDLMFEDFVQKCEQYKPRLVAISHIPTFSGIIQDIYPIGEYCADNNILFLVDACQSIGQLNIKVSELKCDFLSATGRKFLRGPRGTGFLYISKETLLRGFFPLHIDGFANTLVGNTFDLAMTAKRFEYYEKPFALIMGLLEAVKEANEFGMAWIEEETQLKANYLREKLQQVPNLNILDQGKEKGAIISWIKSDESVQALQDKLDSEGVIYGINHKKWAYLDYKPKKIESSIRFSPHYFNTFKEIDQLVDIVKS